MSTATVRNVDRTTLSEEARNALLILSTLPVADVKLVAAGAIPRTTSGKLARLACRAEYLSGELGAH